MHEKCLSWLIRPGCNWCTEIYLCARESHVPNQSQIRI